ncbi:MAG TPA: Gfo/Idh/MocA family oxidoreductase [Phycisphaerae bacterium]|nr:Gfo/Idh/MocA family oxidoreductase [Phycisphaerae bacterium]
MNRREFLKAGAAGTIVSAFGGYFVHGAEQKTLRVGVIGTGWYGKSDVCRLIQVAPVEVVSICDVDKRMLEGAAELIAARQASKRKPRTYGDYREMLKEKDLDIVLIGTPDHWHALPMIAAVEAGADVYVQKPISVDVAEGQAMLAAARRHKRVVQVGTQRRSTPHLIDARKNIVEAGLLGTVAHVEMCCYYHAGREAAPKTVPVPDYLDYEMWTGPAPMRPYEGLPHKGWWRKHMEYGNGILGDMGIHMFDTVRWMLGLGWPKRIASAGGIRIRTGGSANISDTQIATFEYDNLTAVWTHRTWGNAPDPAYPWSLTLYGDKGTLKAGLMSYDFYPAGKNEPAIHKDVVYEREQFPEDLTEKDMELFAAPATRRHMRDFLAAIASRGRPVADIEEGYISSASCILANVAMKLGRTLAWDPAQGRVVGDEEANRLLRRPYRSPWVHPAQTSP